MLSGLLIALITLTILELTLRAGSVLLNRKTATEFSKKHHALRILTVGDSHTYGLYFTRDKAWPAQLEKLLLANNIDAEVINLAYPGTNSTRIRNNIESMLDNVQPDFVLMLVGANDYWTTTFENQKKRDADQIIQWIKENIRIYKLAVFIEKQAAAHSIQKTPVYAYEEDLIDLLHQDPEDAAITLKRILNRLSIETIKSNGKIYLKNGEKQVGLTDIAIQLKELSEQPEKIGGETIKDPSIAILLQLARICKETVGINEGAFRLRNGTASFGGQTYELGPPSSDNIITDFLKIKDLTVANISAINTAVDKHNARLILLNYPFANSVKIFHQNIYIEEAAQKSSIPLINIQKAVNSVCVPAKCPELLIPNDLHPTEKGHQFIANEVYNFLQPYIHDKQGARP